MLRITVLQQAEAATFKLEGKLAHEWVHELESAWAGVACDLKGRPLAVDLIGVSFVDNAGRDLLARMYASGAELVGLGPMMRGLIEEITGGKPRKPRRRRPKKVLLSLLLLAFFVFLFKTTLFAQSSGEILTLEHAIEIALANNRQVRIAELETKKSGLQVDLAKLDRLPTFSTDVYASGLLAPISFEFERGAFGDFPGTGPIPDENTRITTDPTFNVFATAMVKQPISQLYRIGLNVKLKKLGLESQREHERAQRIEVAARVRSTYYEILRLESALRSSQKAILAYRELDRLVERYVVEQTALRGDALDVKAKLLSEQQRAMALRHGVESAKEQLNLLLGRAPETGFEVEAASGAEFGDISLGQVRARALDQRPELKQAELERKQAEYARKIKKSELIPEVGAYVSYLSPFNIETVPKNIATAGVQITWEPFDWGRKRRQVEERQLAAEQADQKLLEVRSQILVEVAAKFRKLEETSVQLQAAELSQETAQEKLRVMTVKYGERAALLNDVLEHEARLSQADHQYQEALLGFWNAKADLKKAMGEE